jgi:hypothetical protein
VLRHPFCHPLHQPVANHVCLLTLIGLSDPQCSKRTSRRTTTLTFWFRRKRFLVRETRLALLGGSVVSFPSAKEDDDDDKGEEVADLDQDNVVVVFVIAVLHLLIPKSTLVAVYSSRSRVKSDTKLEQDEGDGYGKHRVTRVKEQHVLLLSRRGLCVRRCHDIQMDPSQSNHCGGGIQS